MLTADIAVNGAAVSVSGVPFRNAVAGLDNVFMQTTVSGTTTMYVGPVELVTGYALYDNVVANAAGSTPYGWTVDNTGGTGSIQQMKSNAPTDTWSYKLSDTSGSASVSLSSGFAAQTGRMTAEFSFLLPVKTDGMSVQLLSGSTVGVKLMTAGGDIAYENASGTPVTIWSGYKANVWYDIRIVADPSADLADIYINKIKVASQVQFRNNTSNLDAIKAVTSSANTGDMWIDDFKAFTGVYESQVPAPTKVTPDNSITVGVQACDLWREGHHIGYDSMRPYDNRLPLIGYFEDGNPEVADWMIKSLVEHGIGLYMPCWFRNTGGEGFPIKEPVESAMLNEGMLNANGIGLLDFAVSWVAGRATEADFKTNIVPYWIEHYFKHPSYFKIDNKPVIFIYNTSLLNVPVAADFAQVLDDVRNMLIAEGFAGAIFIGENRQTALSNTQALSNRGFDYQYSYTWTTAGISTQQSWLSTIRGYNVLDPIPVLTQGWGDEPWGGSRKTNVPVADFKSGLTWLRDTFMPGYASGSLGGKLILLDNWNEINEGHALMPSNLAGFGYLDAVRSVFYSGTASHADILPRDAGLGPYDQLTPFLY